MRILAASALALGALLTGAAGVGTAGSVHLPAGVVPHAGSVGRSAAQVHATGQPLLYQGGKVMLTNNVYAIYWMPSGSTCDSSDGYTCAQYESEIDQYLTDVGHDSGATTNVYSVDTQYYQGSGSHSYISDNSTFAGSYVDTTAYPANGCNDSHGGNQDPVCLTDAQLQTEILNDIGVNSWPQDTSQPTNLYFIFTPSNVGICFDSSNADCSTNTFCAYHDDFLAGGSANIAYAVEPDNLTIPGGGCDAGPTPAGFGADATINTISHEHNEAITDPWPETNPGWWDIAGEEVADKCAWTYMGYQTMNSHQYYLQWEYSNANSACEPDYTPAPPPPPPPSNSGLPVISGVAAVGKSLSTSAGSWSNSPTGFSYQWQQCTAAGARCMNIPDATSSTYTVQSGYAGQAIRTVVTASNSGGSTTVPSAPTAAVLPVPTNTVAPAVSGVAAVGKTLSTTQGTWNTPVTYTYAWLRCTGSTCLSIAGATTSTYQLASGDAGHTIEAQISATNAAATTGATTAPTAVVINVPAASKRPHISGIAKIGKKLSAAKGTWTSSPTRFTYQWLRCSASGGSCKPISGATKSGYTVGKKDAKHRLRVLVSAVNAAGTTTARSATTKAVPAPAAKKRA